MEQAMSIQSFRITWSHLQMRSPYLRTSFMDRHPGWRLFPVHCEDFVYAIEWRLFRNA
jgi:hypothetical protein